MVLTHFRSRILNKAFEQAQHCHPSLFVHFIRQENGLLFVCVEALRPGQLNGVMSSAVSLPNHAFTGQSSSSKRLTNFVHILSPETTSAFLWISEGREWRRKYFTINLHEKILPTRRGSNPQPPDHQSDAHQTEPPRPARKMGLQFNFKDNMTMD